MIVFAVRVKLALSYQLIGVAGLLKDCRIKGVIESLIFLIRSKFRKGNNVLIVVIARNIVAVVPEKAGMTVGGNMSFIGFAGGGGNIFA